MSVSDHNIEDTKFWENQSLQSIIDIAGNNNDNDLKSALNSLLDVLNTCQHGCDTDTHSHHSNSNSNECNHDCCHHCNNDYNSDSNNNNNSDIKDEKEYLKESLQCPICYALLCEPITLTCGHTFCKMCYKLSSFYDSNSCALCRAKSRVNINEYKTNNIINELTKKYFPDECSARLNETNQKKKEFANTLPIFSLNYSILPGQLLNLKLFEYKYIKMIQTALTRDNKLILYSPKLNGNKINNCKDNNSDSNNDDNNTSRRASKNDIGTIISINKVTSIGHNVIQIFTVLQNRVKINDTFTTNNCNDILFTKFTPFDDDMDEINAISKQNNIDDSKDSDSDSDDDNDNDSSDSDTESDGSNIDDELREILEVIDDFIDDVILSLDNKTSQIITQCCGESIELDNDYKNITEYSFYVASLISSLYRINKNITLRNKNINPFKDNEWMKNIYLTRDPIQRLETLKRIIESVQKW